MYRLLHVLIILISTLHLYGQEHSINVMSFNIRYPNKNDGIHYWDNRRPLVASMIRFHEADLLGVQEAYRRQLDEMVKDMPEYDWYGVCRTDYTTNPDPDDEFSAIIYRKDRFDRLDGNTFWLSEAPEQINTIGWDAALPRIVTWAKFKDKHSGKIFFHFNTHFDHMGVNARNESAKLLLQKVESISGVMPVIITGDFNCTDTDDPYKTLTNETAPNHFTDAMSMSQLPHHGPSASFASNFLISGLSDRRIDYIFIKNGIGVEKHAILSDSWDGKLASDHLPVFAKVIVQ